MAEGVVHSNQRRETVTRLLNNDGSNESAQELDRHEHILSGIQLDDVLAFKNRRSETAADHVLHLIPIIIDFRNILRSESPVEILHGVSNRDLLHAVVALYSVSLAEMTPDVLYSSVCDKWARTIVLLRSVDETLSNLKNNSRCKLNATSPVDDYVYEVETLPKLTEDKYTPSDEKPSIFSDVFSDSDHDADVKDDDVDEDPEEGEDFSSGVNSFIQSVQHRRSHQRRKPRESFSSSEVGIENRLVAAATFEKAFVKPSDRVVHLTLIAVRQRYRRCNVGQYLLTKIKDQSVVGKYDAVVVHADNSAVDFFKKHHFTDDVVLNSRWRELAEQFTQCTLMSYLPPFTTDCSPRGLSASDLDIAAMDNEIHRWQQRSIDAYRAQVSCVSRMRHEVVTLRKLVNSQQNTIEELTTTCEQLRRDKFNIEKEFLDYRLSSAKRSTGVGALSSDSECEDTTEELISQLKLHSARLRTTLKNRPNTSDTS